jgi:hypothetical protein
MRMELQALRAWIAIDANGGDLYAIAHADWASAGETL